MPSWQYIIIGRAKLRDRVIADYIGNCGGRRLCEVVHDCGVRKMERENESDDVDIGSSVSGQSSPSVGTDMRMSITFLFKERSL
jgi:hypothetical protein